MTAFGRERRVRERPGWGRKAVEVDCQSGWLLFRMRRPKADRQQSLTCPQHQLELEGYSADVVLSFVGLSPPNGRRTIGGRIARLIRSSCCSKPYRNWRTGRDSNTCAERVAWRSAASSVISAFRKQQRHTRRPKWCAELSRLARRPMQSNTHAAAILWNEFDTRSLECGA